MDDKKGRKDRYGYAPPAILRVTYLRVMADEMERIGNHAFARQMRLDAMAALDETG